MTAVGALVERYLISYGKFLVLMDKPVARRFCHKEQIEKSRTCVTMTSIKEPEMYQGKEDTRCDPEKRGGKKRRTNVHAFSL